MTVPFDAKLKIVAYRDFHDVPRLILARDTNGSDWILDCPFDDSTDEYSQEYSVYFVGDDILASGRVFDSWAVKSASAFAGSIAVRQVQFDSSRREELTCVRACDEAN